jgi:hypothetical protein
MMEIRKYSYEANPEIPDRANQEIHDYRTHYGDSPKSLLVGYGTYLCLCFVATSRQLPRCQYAIKITDWQGIPLVIDPGYEFRVTAIGNGDLFDQACRYFEQNQRSK